MAMDCFNRVLDIDNENIHALRSKIMCFIGINNLSDALVFSGMAVKVIPNEPSLWFIKATIEDNSGKSKEAAMSYLMFLRVATPEMAEEIKMATGRLCHLGKNDK